jgi:hypothetical protein
VARFEILSGLSSAGLHLIKVEKPCNGQKKEPYPNMATKLDLKIVIGGRGIRQKIWLREKTMLKVLLTLNRLSKTIINWQPAKNILQLPLFSESKALGFWPGRWREKYIFRRLKWRELK